MEAVLQALSGVAQQSTAGQGQHSGVVGGTLPPEVVNSSPFRVYCFKILPCPRKHGHDWTACPFAHVGEKAGRRCPQKHAYLPIACPDIKRAGECPRGLACNYAHNVFEFWCHPLRFRTQLCSFGSECKRSICFFAHSFAELRVVDSSALQELERQLEVLGEAAGFGFPPAGRRTREDMRTFSHTEGPPHHSLPTGTANKDAGFGNSAQLQAHDMSPMHPGNNGRLSRSSTHSTHGANTPRAPVSGANPLSPDPSSGPLPMTPADTAAATATLAAAMASAATASAISATSGAVAVGLGAHTLPVLSLQTSAAHAPRVTSDAIVRSPTHSGANGGDAGASPALNSPALLMLQLQAELSRHKNAAQAQAVATHDRVSSDRVYAAAVLLDVDPTFLGQLLAQNPTAPPVAPAPTPAAVQAAMLQSTLLQLMGGQQQQQAQPQPLAALMQMLAGGAGQQQQQQLLPSLTALMGSASGTARSQEVAAAAALQLSMQGQSNTLGRKLKGAGESLLSPLASLVSPLPCIGPMPSLSANDDQMAATMKLLAEMSASSSRQAQQAGNSHHHLQTSTQTSKLQAHIQSLTAAQAQQLQMRMSEPEEHQGHRSTNSDASVDSLIQMMTELTGRMSGALDSADCPDLSGGGLMGGPSNDLAMHASLSSLLRQVQGGGALLGGGGGYHLNPRDSMALSQRGSLSHELLMKGSLAHDLHVGGKGGGHGPVAAPPNRTRTSPPPIQTHGQSYGSGEGLAALGCADGMDGMGAFGGASAAAIAASAAAQAGISPTNFYGGSGLGSGLLCMGSSCIGGGVGLTNGSSLGIDIGFPGMSRLLSAPQPGTGHHGAFFGGPQLGGTRTGGGGGGLFGSVGSAAHMMPPPLTSRLVTAPVDMQSGSTRNGLAVPTFVCDNSLTGSEDSDSPPPSSLNTTLHSALPGIAEGKGVHNSSYSTSPVASLNAVPNMSLTQYMSSPRMKGTKEGAARLGVSYSTPLGAFDRLDLGTESNGSSTDSATRLSGMPLLGGQADKLGDMIAEKVTPQDLTMLLTGNCSGRDDQEHQPVALLTPAGTVSGTFSTTHDLPTEL